MYGSNNTASVAWSGASMKSLKGTKKSLKGFTLLELVVAMSITIMFLPLLGVVFYQLSVWPADNGMQLSINSEVDQLAARLYQDGQMADNFTLGNSTPNTYPYYYGNFSWTNYSTNVSYLVSYYYTCIDSNNSYCNHIARRVTITQLLPPLTTTITSFTPSSGGPGTSVTITGTDFGYVGAVSFGGTAAANFTVNSNTQITAAVGTGSTGTISLTTANGIAYSSDIFTFIPAPTPIPTPTPLPTTYTYCSGGGTDKWAFGKTWTNAEWVTQGRPTNPADFFGSSSYPVVGGTNPIYSWICSNDTNSWRQGSANANPDVDSQIYGITVYQGRSITNLSITWIGHGSTSGNTTLKIWNTVTGWVTLWSVTSPPSQGFQTYVSSITTNPGQYVDAGSGGVLFLVSADDNSNPATQGLYTDYIALTVQ
jgi:hypothetical protein